MNELAERAKAYATKSAERIEANIAREWWVVRKPAGETIELFVPDRMTHAEVQKLYPHAGVLPR